MADSSALTVNVLTDALSTAEVSSTSVVQSNVTSGTSATVNLEAGAIGPQGPAGPAATNPVSSVNSRVGAVTGLAEDANVVHLLGTETVTGTKTFKKLRGDHYRSSNTPPAAGSFSGQTAVATGANTNVIHNYLLIGVDTNGNHSFESTTSNFNIMTSTLPLTAANFVTVSWTTPVAPVRTLLYRRLESISTNPWRLIADLPGTTLSYVDNDSTAFISDLGAMAVMALRNQGSYSSLTMRKAFITERETGYSEWNNGTNDSTIAMDGSGVYLAGSNVTINGNKPLAAVGANKLTVSGTAPTSPLTGDIWIDTT